MDDIFKTLPDIELITFCGRLDTPSLLNLSEASSRVYQICEDEIKKRKREFEENLRRIEAIKNAIRSNFSNIFEKKIDNFTVKVETINSWGKRGHLNIRQTIEPLEGSENIPWILPAITPEWDGVLLFNNPEERNRSVLVPREDIINELAKNLYNQKYKLIQSRLK